MASFTARLLVATPTLTEGIFARSVVLVLHHDEEGAQGLILNRPVQARVGEALPGWEKVVSPPDLVFHGGPVGQDSALGVARCPGDERELVGLRRLFGSLALVDLDAPTEIVAGQIAGMRIFAGYSGWSAGQLDQEVENNSWWVVDREVEDVMTHEPHNLWHLVLARQSGDLALVASYPPDPTLN